jgi:nucleoside-diphosphate-sugar epimerase
MQSRPFPAGEGAGGSEFEAFRAARVLVSGGAGFIGSALCSALVEAGAVVHSVSRRPNGPPDVERHWQVDLGDVEPTTSVVREVRPDYVFHLASHVWGAPDLKHVLPSFRGNLQSSVNLMHALTEQGCKRFITTGSLVEPDPNVAQKVPNSPYAAAKWASSDYARMFHALYGLPVAIARVFMVYGPGQQDETKLVPYVIRCVQAGRPPQITSGVHQIDWIFVEDVVRGFLKLATAANVDGQSADLGSGTVVSTASLVTQICDLMDAGVRPVFGALPDRPLEPKRIANIEASERLIGWKPRVDLTAGLTRTIAWYGSHPETK